MKGIEIRDFMGDYALDIPMGDRSVHTIYFNSRRNAETVKRIMEVDDSKPNAATVCDMVEVVRCKDCIHSVQLLDRLMCNRNAHKSENGWFGLRATADKHFCSYGERKEQQDVWWCKSFEMSDEAKECYERIAPLLEEMKKWKEQT